MGASNFMSRSLLLTFSLAVVFLFSVNLGVAEGGIATGVVVNKGKENVSADTGSALVPMETETGIGNISTSLNLISHLVNMTSGNETEKTGTGKSRCVDNCPTECETTCHGNSYTWSCSESESYYSCICKCSGSGTGGGGDGDGDGGGSDFIQPTASLFFISAALSIIQIGGFGVN